MHPTASSPMKPTTAPLRELCERYGVERLELFGSAARGKYDPAHSDLDQIAATVH